MSDLLRLFIGSLLYLPGSLAHCSFPALLFFVSCFACLFLQDIDVDHDHGDLPVILQYANLAAGLSAIYLLFQAFLFARGSTWVRIPSILYAALTFMHLCLRVFVWVAGDDSRDPFYVLILKLVPSVLLVTFIARHQIRQNTPLSSNRHKD